MNLRGKKKELPDPTFAMKKCTSIWLDFSRRFFRILSFLCQDSQPTVILFRCIKECLLQDRTLYTFFNCWRCQVLPVRSTTLPKNTPDIDATLLWVQSVNVKGSWSKKTWRKKIFEARHPVYFWIQGAERHHYYQPSTRISSAALQVSWRRERAKKAAFLELSY